MGRTDFLARYPRARRVFDKARRDVAEYEAAVARWRAMQTPGSP